MDNGDKKYEMVLNVLKKSKPELMDAEAFSDKIIKLLQEEKSKISLQELIIEFLFGWVYIGWVRRSMVAVALSVILLFGYQQALILRRINDLSDQKVTNGKTTMTSLTDEFSDKILLYRISGKKLTDGKINISEKEIDRLIKSVNRLQVKYQDIIYLIENDPELKKYIEAKMNKSKKN